MRSVLLGAMLSLMAAFTHAEGEQDFFSNIDATIEIGDRSARSASEGRKSNLTDSSQVNDRVATDRYLRLLARLYIYAYFCDQGNAQGYSTAVSRIYQTTGHIQKEAGRHFRGRPGIENRLDEYRNQEMARFAREGGAALCQGTHLRRFHEIVGMDADGIVKYITARPAHLF